MKKGQQKLYLLTSIMAMFIAGCQEVDEIEPGVPVISFENSTSIYNVKVGKEITIEPIIKNDNDAIYLWTVEGKIVSDEKTLTYSWNKSGQVFIIFKVYTEYGSDNKEIRVDVAELLPPVISLVIPDEGYTIMTGSKLNLTPQVDNNEGATYRWLLNDTVVSEEKDYVFMSENKGNFKLMFIANNEDGARNIDMNIFVKTPEEMPFSWLFEKTLFNVSKGRTIKLMPYSIKNAFDAEYIWSVSGEEVQRNSSPIYAFTAADEGDYDVTLTMANSYASLSQTVTVNVCPSEGAFKRPVSTSVCADWNKVYEFMPAPGQFVNENHIEQTMDGAILYAEDRLRDKSCVSLGGFGGYIVFGFDHSIENDGGYNIEVKGNSLLGSSEPGVLWVMQDENGDGKPNDTWYELAGSEYGKPETIQDYEITYYRPRAAQMPVVWMDNQGDSGSIDYLIAYSQQEYYYPLWIESTSYTLIGTKLKSRTRETSPGYWSNDAFGWGYADNFSDIDRLTSDDNFDAGVNTNHFKISDAMTFDGKHANLKYIDFIKIQTGVNAKAGWLGENSTEVFGIRDFNMVKNK